LSKAALRKVRFWRILLKKSFGGGGRNFLKLLMRFVRGDLRDHVASQKGDYGPSYWRCGSSQRRSCPKIKIVPDDAEPSGVADEIVKVVDMPFGKRLDP
jgi:hypothetical protein